MKHLIILFLLISNLVLNGQNIIDKTFYKTSGLSVTNEKNAKFIQLTILNSDSSYTVKLIAIKDSAILRTEYYKDNTEIGIWSSKNEKGLKDQYDYNFELEYCENPPTNINESPGYVSAKFENGSFNSFILKQVHYPLLAVSRNISGKVVAKFTIDTDGKVGDICILKSVHKLLDKEVIRAIKTSSNWIPASINGQKIKGTFIIPVLFTK